MNINGKLLKKALKLKEKEFKIAKNNSITNHMNITNLLSIF